MGELGNTPAAGTTGNATPGIDPGSIPPPPTPESWTNPEPLSDDRIRQATADTIDRDAVDRAREAAAGTDTPQPLPDDRIRRATSDSIDRDALDRAREADAQRGGGHPGDQPGPTAD